MRSPAVDVWSTAGLPELCNAYGEKQIGKDPAFTGGDVQLDALFTAGVVELIPAQFFQLHPAQHPGELPKNGGDGAVARVHDLRLLKVGGGLEGGHDVGDGGQAGVRPR